jgi:hypothetical protein
VYPCGYGVIAYVSMGENGTDSRPWARSRLQASELSLLCDAYRRFLRDSLALGRRVWTQYDLELMGWGLALLLATLLFALFSLTAREWVVGPGAGGTWGGVVAGVVAASVGSVALPRHFLQGSRCLAIPAVAIIMTVVGGLLGGGAVRRGVVAARGVSRWGWGGLALVVLHASSLFSNSYIEAEHKVYLFLGSAAVAVLALAHTGGKTTGEAQGVKRCFCLVGHICRYS